jgi:hypothetical protein
MLTGEREHMRLFHQSNQKFGEPRLIRQMRELVFSVGFISPRAREKLDTRSRTASLVQYRVKGRRQKHCLVAGINEMID